MTAMMWWDGSMCARVSELWARSAAGPNRLCHRRAEQLDMPSRGSEEGAIRMIRVDTRTLLDEDLDHLRYMYARLAEEDDSQRYRVFWCRLALALGQELEDRHELERHAAAELGEIGLDEWTLDTAAFVDRVQRDGEDEPRDDPGSAG